MAARRTRIVATLGPATDRPGVLREVIAAGADVVRLNASHGTRADHLRRLTAVREIARELGRNVGVLLDLQGPKIRVGELPVAGVVLREGERFTLTNRRDASGASLVTVDYEPLPREVAPGNRLFLDDGNIALCVERTDGKDIECAVERGGVLTSHKGINAPGAALSAAALTEKDREDAAFGVTNEVDFIALSFVRRAADVLALRQVAGGAAIVAKIERPEALSEIDGILEAADAIMVARGDLGVEIPLEEVPMVQRTLLHAANRAAKPAITATQMLESMVTHPRPTRAEATDVHVAVTQLTDAVMLSAETAVGRYPADAVRAMAKIALAAETDPALLGAPRAKIDVARDATEAVAQAACEVAAELGACAIVCSTSSGFTPRVVAKYRPDVPIVALAHDARVRRRLSLTWGVDPVASPPIRSTDEMLAAATRTVIDAGVAKLGDVVVITAGVPVGTPGHTNLIKVHRLGDPITSGI
ncbi:MAG TPA: pyruvate kinase [Chloroflexota bacterium]|nr:pyruvate kinase [Chloroflexota bacterium]